MDLERGAGLLHRLTSYRPERVWDVPADDPRLRHDLTPNDPATLPPPAKRYPADLPRTALPRDLPQPGVSATAALAGAPAPGRARSGRPGRRAGSGAGAGRGPPRPGAVSRRRGGPDVAALLGDAAVPCRRIGRWPVPAGDLREYPRGRWRAGRGALVRPLRARSGAGRPGGRRRRDHAGGDRRAVADRLAL